MLSLILAGLLFSGVYGASVERRQLVASPCRHTACTSSMMMTVCGSDGATYSSYCSLQMAACQARLVGRELHLAHYGSCTAPQVLPNTQQCNQICDEEVQSVCGSDGTVYQNTCLFQRAQCAAAHNGTNLFIVSYTDTCPTPRTPDCSRYHIDTSDLAIEGGTQIGNMQCPSTDHHYVCSTDGRTFLNECLLCHYIDMHQAAHIKILTDGACHTTSHLIYPYQGPGGAVVGSSGGVAVDPFGGVAPDVAGSSGAGSVGGSPGGVVDGGVAVAGGTANPDEWILNLG